MRRREAYRFLYRMREFDHFLGPKESTLTRFLFRALLPGKARRMAIYELLCWETVGCPLLFMELVH